MPRNSRFHSSSTPPLPSSPTTKAKGFRERLGNFTRSQSAEAWDVPLLINNSELPSPTLSIAAGASSSLLPLIGLGIGVSPLALFTTSDKDGESKKKISNKKNKENENTIAKGKKGLQKMQGIFSKNKGSPKTEVPDDEPQLKDPSVISPMLLTRTWRSFEWGDPNIWGHPPWTQFSPIGERENEGMTGNLFEVPLTATAATAIPEATPIFLPKKTREREPPTRLDLFKIKNTSQAGTGSAVCEKCAQIFGVRSQYIKSTANANAPYVQAKGKVKISQQSSVPLTQPLSLDIDEEDNYYCSKQRLLSESELAGAGGGRPLTSNSNGNGTKKQASRNAEKRRRFFAKKQNNSAPGGFGYGESLGNVIQTTRRFCNNCKEPVTNCLEGVLPAVLRREKAGDTSTITPPSVEVWESEIRTVGCGDVAVTHVSELDYPDADPPCHFCCEQASTAIHDESRLQIVSGGLLRSRDGSTRGGSAPYINLPSPNVQTEAGQQAFGSLDVLSPSISMSQNLLSPSNSNLPLNLTLGCPHRLSTASSCSSRGGSIVSSTVGGAVAGVGTAVCGVQAAAAAAAGVSTSTSPVPEEPPLASALTIRRPALIPPKIIPDAADFDNESEKDKTSGRSSDEFHTPRNRRSSMVVIPPMQICPGDLLVYGKVLSQRKSLLGTPIESPSRIPTMFDPETQNRKKASWSLLKLFERPSRPKSGTSGNLETLMSLLQPCDFSDPKLSRFKGMVWFDFVAHVQNQKTKKSGSVISSESGSSGPSNSPSLSDFGKGGNAAGGTNGNAGQKQEVLKLSTSTAMAGVISSPTKVVNPPPKPLVRKRMGLMRTMSDRCLERRITPALFKAQGFLMSEKLVEGKETETPGKDQKDVEGKPVEPVSTSIGDQAGTSGTGATLVTSGFPRKGSSGDEADPERRQKLRQKEALWDLFQSECSFLYDHLMVLKNVFMEPLKKIQVEGFAMYAEPELLFGNLDELCAVTYAFCKEFIHLLLTLTDPSGELPTTQVLAKLFEQSSKVRIMSQAYHRYALNYINALNYLETLRRQLEFCEFEKLCMKDPRCKKLQLTDLLVSPVQHLMKVPLILKDILSRTEEPQERELVIQILELQETSIRELDDKMKWLKNFERLLEIQRNIIWPNVLEMEPKTWVPEFLRPALSRQPCDSIVVSPRRQIIHEGLLQLWDTGKPSECYVILFDDMLLITRRKKGLSKKKSSLSENWQSACGKTSSSEGANHRYIVYRQPISLDRFFIHDIVEGESNIAKLEYAFVLVSLNRFQQIIAVHTFQAAAETLKNAWLHHLKVAQDKWKRTLQTTVFRGVRSSTDSGQSNVASSILGLAHNKPLLQRHNTCDSTN